MFNPIKQAVISLGGKGSRLKSISKDIPKPLFPINGLSCLERAIENLSIQGVKEYIWLLGFKSNLFLDNIERLSKKYDVNIRYYIENLPLGDCGGLLKVLDILNKDFLFISGDIIFNFDLERMNYFHIKNKSDITLCTHTTSHPEDSDCIVESPSLKVALYSHKKDKLKKPFAFLGNAGIVILSKKVILKIAKITNLGKYELSLFDGIAIKGLNYGFRVFSYNTSEYIKDIGTPERLEEMKIDLEKGIIEKRSYKRLQKALFLDRDNTLIKCKQQEYITKISQLELIENNLKTISLISKSFDLVILISNQPQISMGLVNMQEVIQINGYLINQCQNHHLNISAFYICPHHIDSGFNNENFSLKYSCFCRKPSPGLFYRAAYERNIDLSSSLMIGDSWRDKYAAEGLKMNFCDIKNIKSFLEKLNKNK